MIWDFFTDIYILNQESRPDRWMLCKRELARIGIETYSQFLSIPAEIPKDSFCKSQLEMLKTFAREGKDSLLALEDDFKMDFGWENILSKAIEQLPQDWDVLYLGCNVRNILPDQYSENLVIPHNPWMTHAVAYTKKAAEWITNEYDANTGQMFDDWLAENIHRLKTFLVKPMVSYQNPNFSDIWGCHTDYTETHKQGNRLL